MSRTFFCTLLLAAVAFGQGSPTFEVASIRPSSEQVSQVTAGLRIAGSQVRFTAMSPKELIVIAYGVKPQQIAGPSGWGSCDLMWPQPFRLTEPPSRCPSCCARSSLRGFR